MIAFPFHDLGLRLADQKAVVRKAARAGKTVPQYVRELIEQDLLAEKTFDDILRPVRADVRKSGVTQNQLDAIVKRAR
jgi:hypothetical protein